MAKAVDYAGRHFGHSVVLRRSAAMRTARGLALWLIGCGCGNTFVRSSPVLAKAAGKSVLCNVCLSRLRAARTRAWRGMSAP